jgi:hypothetical protein
LGTPAPPISVTLESVGFEIGVAVAVEPLSHSMPFGLLLDTRGHCWTTAYWIFPA